jgi:flagellar hook assembly protein FlgD
MTLATMTRHRRSLARLLAPLALALAPALRPAPAAAQSVQVFVNSAWVNSTETGLCGVSLTPPYQFTCPFDSAANPGPVAGTISNEPHIEFEDDGANRCNIDNSIPLTAAGPIPGTNGRNFCNHQVFLCAQIGIQNNTAGQVAIDEVNFELFKYQDGSNALDPASTPPLRTFFIDAPGSASNGVSDTLPSATEGYCVLWDGSINIQGELGKSNGQYGFRVTVKTNQQGQSGNIVITQTRAYPSGATRDTTGAVVSQKPIIVDVTNVHVVRSSPTIVGQITGVAAQPYNLTYRLAKDATMFITIDNALPPYDELRKVLPGLPRVGEGIPNGTLLNGDSWDGRDEFGNVLPPGVYLADFQAISLDQYTRYAPGASVFGDLSFATTRQIAIDPLQITDIRVQPLLGGATNLAVLSYLLTESATVYVDIYAPGTQFCPVAGVDPLNHVNDTALDQAPPLPPKNFNPTLGTCAGGTASPVLRRITEQKQLRTSVITFWDGRDQTGNFVSDGDYVFVIYAALPSQRGYPLNANANDKRVWTSQARVGFISVLRGLVGITQVSPTSSVIGSSPAVAGLNPFTFRYQLSRDAVVNMKVFDETGTVLIKTLVLNETRPGAFTNSETWVDGTDDSGRVVSSGTYLIQLTASDPMFPAKVSTVTASFPVNMFRITDVAVSPLLSGATENVILNYQLSQPMFVAWNIYPPGSVVQNSTGSWPPCANQTPPSACTSNSVVSPGGAAVAPVVHFRGLRPGRLKISEFWDGRDVNGLFVPDGNYVFTLTAESTTTPRYFATDRVHGIVTVARGSIIFTNFNVNPDVPSLVNSSNTITLHPFTINYSLTRQSSVTVQILNTNLPPAVVRTLVSGAVRQGGILNTDVWDGRDDRGNFPPAGFYLVRAVANDVASVLSSGSTAQLTISYDPLRIYDLAIAPLRLDTGGALLSYQVSEPMKVSIKIYAPGTVFDAAGNPSPPESVSLVRRIVGVRPGRTEIQDIWDGRDFKLSLVKDGVYKFKIVGSTDLAAIDDVTGNVINPTALSLDRLIDEIPVVRNASVSPREDFENNTFAFPNPVTGASATFNIFSPFKARATLRLFTISGELVLERNFGEVAPSFQSGPTQFVWGKTNTAGRTVGRGLYFAVVRLDETEGGRSVLQTVKKVLVP